ncbi:RETICULATA-RELATED 1 protein [Nymphaea thermarum]|nr:RETICULATA-RELATED 1 protein [Nymphaea thermarum]
MAVSSLRFGLASAEFESLQSNREFNLLGFSSPAGFRRMQNGVTLVSGRKCGSRVRVHSFSVRSEMSVQKETVDVVTPKKVEGASSSDGFIVKDEQIVLQKKLEVDNGHGGGSFGGVGGDGGEGSGGRGGRDDGDGGEFDKGDEDMEEFGPILKFDEVMREIQARGATLPADMLEAAKTVGIRKIILSRYLDLQGSVWPLGRAIQSCGMLRNRMLADPAFLFKVGTEIVIDSSCATFAEVQKRGKDFWQEFELYLADLLVGVVVDIALVGMLAPYVRFGRPPVAKGFLGGIRRTCGALPSSVFEAERPGCRFSVQQRIGTYFYKGVMYASVGFACGIIGQGIANMVMTAKRQIKSSEHDIPVPPLVKSAALWGVFLAVSSNARYQIVNGLERVVEGSPLARQVPPVALAFTVGVRFANNIYGGMQFVDWARWSGCQ